MKRTLTQPIHVTKQKPDHNKAPVEIVNRLLGVAGSVTPPISPERLPDLTSAHRFLAFLLIFSLPFLPFLFLPLPLLVLHSPCPSPLYSTVVAAAASWQSICCFPVVLVACHKSRSTISPTKFGNKQAKHATNNKGRQKCLPKSSFLLQQSL